MAGVFLALMVLGYLVFLIDWRELRGVLGQGGWATVCFYAVVTALIISVVASPGATTPVFYN